MATMIIPYPRIIILLLMLFFFPSVMFSQNKDSVGIATDSTLVVDSIVRLPRVHTGIWKSQAVRISIAPAAFFAASALTWSSREQIREVRNRYIPHFHHTYDNYLQYVPAAMVFGLNAVGVKGKHTVKRAFVSYAFSAFITLTIVNSLKYTTHVERPDGSADNSFPSGHTSNSFMNATFLHKEYGQYRDPLYSVLGYATATATGISRELNNRHWVSDVLAGAGIGILSTELGYLIADAIYKDRGLRPPHKYDPFPINKKPSFLEMRIGFAKAISEDLTGKSDKLTARTGFNIGLEGAYFFTKNIGLGGEFAFSSFPIKEDNFAITDPDIIAISDDHYTQPMGVRYLTIGPYFSIPLPRNYFITAKLTAGTSVGAEGNVTIELNDDASAKLKVNEIAYLKYKPERAFAWTCGFSFQKRIGRNTGLKLYTGYFHSIHDFNTQLLEDVDPNGNYIYTPDQTERVDFSHFVIGIGLSAFLWR